MDGETKLRGGSPLARASRPLESRPSPSLREEDLLADGFVWVAPERCKTRRHKFGWLRPARYAELEACSADGWAFGRFSDELRRLLILWMKRPNHATRVKDFAPNRLVSWLQEEVKRFQVGREGDHFTLHDFRRTGDYRPANGRRLGEGNLPDGGGNTGGHPQAL